jgi:predicted small metal-binding protein
MLMIQQMPKIMTGSPRPWMVRAGGYCHHPGCGWLIEVDDSEDVVKAARKHCLETGHDVTVETGYVQHYKRVA